MGYGRLRQSDPGGHDSIDHQDIPLAATWHHRGGKIILLITLLSLTLIIISAAGSVAVIKNQNNQTEPKRGRNLLSTSHPISKICTKARYPDLCVRSLLEVSESTATAATSTELDLVHMSFNVTLHRFAKALYVSSAIASNQMDPRVRSAYEDCIELLDDSVDALSRSLTTVARGISAAHAQDVITWLSAALTNHDTCTEGFEDLRGPIKDRMTEKLKDLSKLVSNCLAIFSATAAGEDFSGVPIQNKRRLMEVEGVGQDDDEFPSWVGRRERRLLQMPVKQMPVDIVVSKDGNGTVKTIAEAIKKVPEWSSRRFVIHVKAGRYEENNLKIGRKKTNVMIVGEGKGVTIISGSKSVFDNITTFRTAAFAASGAGFIAKDLTFENWAGPEKRQAVALRVGADHAVVYRCNIIGYQDTLYVHSNRQFYRECDIYGTVDFVFGNAAVVLQNCSLYARKPMTMQKNTITAQNRKDPNQNTGISIHACRVLPTQDLQAANHSFQTYLGRPWKLYSRTVYMQSYIGDLVHPKGWLEWNGTFALDSLYYGEYKNYGPGATLGQRVQWPGYRNITSPAEASKFTVKEFIFGSLWLPSTGVAFVDGLFI